MLNQDPQLHTQKRTAESEGTNESVMDKFTIEAVLAGHVLCGSVDLQTVCQSLATRRVSSKDGFLAAVPSTAPSASPISRTQPLFAHHRIVRVSERTERHCLIHTLAARQTKQISLYPHRYHYADFEYSTPHGQTKISHDPR